MDEVKYKKGDIVLFRYGQKIKNGTIVIVDAQGTFFQQEEPSYDIECLIRMDCTSIFGNLGFYRKVGEINRGKKK